MTRYSGHAGALPADNRPPPHDDTWRVRMRRMTMSGALDDRTGHARDQTGGGDTPWR